MQWLPSTSRPRKPAGQETAIKNKEEKALPVSKKAHDNAQPDKKAEALKKLQAVEAEIEALKKSLPDLQKAELAAKAAADQATSEATIEIAKLEGQLTTAREQVAAAGVVT